MGFFSRIYGKKTTQNPEDAFEFTITDDFVRADHPKRKTEEILWKDINEIKLTNKDAGPFTPDFYLL